MDFSIGCLTFFDGVQEDKERLSMPGTGGRYFITARDVEDHCGRNDFEARPG